MLSDARVTRGDEPSQQVPESKTMQMANQNMSRFGINPSTMRLPMGAGRTFVLNQRHVPGVGFSNGFGVINPRGQGFYLGQSTSFRGGGSGVEKFPARRPAMLHSPTGRAAAMVGGRGVSPPGRG